MRLSYSLLATLPSLALAAPTQDTQNKTGIEWTPCKIYGTRPGDCGKLMVPLDYTDDDSGEEIPLIISRVPATKRPKKGSILFNFGGPGANGIEDLSVFADHLLAATGGHHDLINVSPRGTNGTLTFSCFADETQRSAGTSNFIAGNASDVAPGEVWARANIFTNTCAVAQNETGRFVGTAFTARDHMRVVDALGEDGMLRYWGFSYGTILGSTMIAMFPDKIDKIVLDGVANPFEYYQNAETELMTSTDDVFRGFCKGCVAAPKECPIAGNMTAEQLEQSLYAMIDNLKANPIPVPDPNVLGGGTLITYSLVKATLLRQLYFPILWPSTAKLLAAVAAGSGEALAGGSGSDGGVGGDEAQLGIKCSDVLQHADKLTDVAPILEQRHRLSRFGDTADQVLAQCAQWKLPAKERYDGDFNNVKKTKNPVLIVNNRYDPVTPLVSARNVSQTFEGSVLLEQNGYGHISLVQGSICTAKAIRSYFMEGKLPKEGTVCDVKAKLFSGKDGWEEVIKELNGNSTST